MVLVPFDLLVMGQFENQQALNPDRYLNGMARIRTLNKGVLFLTVHAKTAVSFIQSDYSNHPQTDRTFDLSIMLLRERMRVMLHALRLQKSKFKLTHYRFVVSVDTRWLSQKTRDAPDGHYCVKNHGRPQGDADKSRADAGQSEDESRADVIKHHRADQSSRGAALRVVLREPAGDAERKQRHPGHATERNARADEFAA